MNKPLITESFDSLASPKKDDFLSKVEKKLKNGGFTTYRHNHDDKFSILKIIVPQQGSEPANQVHLYHDKYTELVEAFHLGTGASEHSGHLSQALTHEISDLALGVCAFLSLNEETPLRRDLENMMNNLPRAKVTEATVMPSQHYQEFISRRATHIGLHAV